MKMESLEFAQLVLVLLWCHNILEGYDLLFDFTGDYSYKSQKRLDFHSVGTVKDYGDFWSWTKHIFIRLWLQAFGNQGVEIWWFKRKWPP